MVQPGVDTDLSIYSDALTETLAHNDDVAPLNRGSQIDLTVPDTARYWIKVFNLDIVPRGAGQTYNLSVVEYLPTEAGCVGPFARRAYMPILIGMPRVATSATPTAEPTAELLVTPTPANLRECSSSDPNWRGSNPAYPFCVGKDLNWTDGGKELRYFFVGQDFTLTGSWDLYGIAGIWFIVEPSGQVCDPAGTSVINRQTVGTGQESFNVRDLAGGGYKVHLRIKRNSDGVEVDYNERYLCVGNSPATLPPPATTATIWPTALP